MIEFLLDRHIKDTYYMDKMSQFNRVSVMLDYLRKAIFSVLCIKRDGSQSGFYRGTAFGICSNLLVTCEHVVRDAMEVWILSGEQTLDGKKGIVSKVVAVDQQRDLALLRVTTIDIPFLKLSTIEQIDNAIPLLVWTWHGWHEWDMKQDKGPNLRCVHRAAVMTDCWSSGKTGIQTFGFAGHVEDGMSGGPVVSALTGEIVGVTIACWPIDPDQVADAWQGVFGNLHNFSGNDGPAPDEVVRAQLGLGIGIALPVYELRRFLEIFPVDLAI